MLTAKLRAWHGVSPAAVAGLGDGLTLPTGADYRRRNVVQLLETYGTVGGWKSDAPKPKPLYLQGALPFTMSPTGWQCGKF